MRVYIESSAENYVPQLALNAHYLLKNRGDQWVRPVATADALMKFLDSWRCNDPNGVWGYAVEVADALLYTRVDEDEPTDQFPLVTRTMDGRALYDLTGWRWVAGDQGGTEL